METTLRPSSGHTHTLPAKYAQTRVIVSRGLELLALAFYICLLYKQAALGIALLCLIIVLGSFVRPRFSYILSPLGLFTIGYLAFSTTTAFLTGFDQGLYRTLQFVILLAAFALLCNYLEQLHPRRQEAVFRAFCWITVLAFAHMILYHLYIGRFTTWKYLYDTKTTISIVAVLIFLAEDRIVRRYGAGVWCAVLLGYGILLLLSGERKAYILFGILFFLSRIPVAWKALFSLVVALSLALFVSVSEPGSYVARQVESLFAQKTRLADVAYDEDIGEQSDLIREFVNSNARKLFMQNPAFGIGANGYYAWSTAQFGDSIESKGLNTNVHGEINRVPVEGGVLGIFIALGYLFTLALAVFRGFRRVGYFRSGAMERAPLYVFSFLFLYLYVEALDTLMLSMIVLFGFHMARMTASVRSRNAPS